jgi:hypothetical protein
VSQPKKIAAARKAAKLRNWRAWLLRQRAQPLGTVEATDERTAADCVGCHGQQAATHLAMVENYRLTTWKRAPRSDIFRCVRPRRSTSRVTHTRTWEALVSWPIRGLSSMADVMSNLRVRVEGARLIGLAAMNEGHAH